MSRLSIPSLDTAPEASKPTLDAVNRQLGVVPNLFRLIGSSPAALAGFTTWDQWATWSTKDDYTFGYLVPVFVAYVLWDRWPELRALLAMRNLLRDLKSNLLDNASFRRELEKILKDDSLSSSLRSELERIAPIDMPQA